MKLFSFYQNISYWKDRFSQAHWCNNQCSAARTAEDASTRSGASPSKWHQANRMDPTASIISASLPPQKLLQFLCQRGIWGYIFKISSSVREPEKNHLNKNTGTGDVQSTKSLLPSLTVWKCLKVIHQIHNLMMISCVTLFNLLLNPVFQLFREVLNDQWNTPSLTEHPTSAVVLPGFTP